VFGDPVVPRESQFLGDLLVHPLNFHDLQFQLLPRPLLVLQLSLQVRHVGLLRRLASQTAHAALGLGHGRPGYLAEC